MQPAEVLAKILAIALAIFGGIAILDKLLMV